MNRNPCKGWKQNDHVTILKADGSERGRGRVVIFKSKAGRWTLMVSILSTGSGMGNRGERVWPEGWILGVGKITGRCLKCEQDYRADDTSGGFCPACYRERNAAHAAHSGIRKPLAYMRGARNAATRRHVDTPEDIAAREQQRRQDELESPFG